MWNMIVTLQVEKATAAVQLCASPLGNSSWSRTLQLSDSPALTVVELHCPKPNTETPLAQQQYSQGGVQVAVRVVPVTGCDGCYAMHMMPRHVIQNTLGDSLQVRIIFGRTDETVCVYAVSVQN